MYMYIVPQHSTINTIVPSSGPFPSVSIIYFLYAILKGGKLETSYLSVKGVEQ